MFLCGEKHLVVVQVLLDEVAFSFNPGLHLGGNVRNHPRHEELHHKRHMLKRDERRKPINRERGRGSDETGT